MVLCYKTTTHLYQILSACYSGVKTTCQIAAVNKCMNFLKTGLWVEVVYKAMDKACEGPLILFHCKMNQSKGWSGDRGEC